MKTNAHSHIGLVARLTVALLAGCGGDRSTPPANAPLELTASPPEPGSLAPYLAPAPDGRIVMSWLEPTAAGYALRHSSWDGAWSEAATVAEGGNWFVNWADFPSVVPLPNGLWAAHWLVRRPAGGYAYDVYMALSHDAGATWTEGVVAHSDGTDTEHGFVSIYPEGSGAGFLHLDGRKMVNEVTDDPNASGMTLRSAVLRPGPVLADEQLVDPLTCDCCQTDVAMTSEGPVAVYRNRTENEIRDIFVTRRVDGRWQPGVPIADDSWEIPGCPVNGPEIHASGSNVAVAWFTAAAGRPRVRFARSSDAGRSFSAPIEIASGDLLGHVGLTVDETGTAWVLWQQKEPGGAATLALRAVDAGGEPGGIRLVDQGLRSAPFSVPQIATLPDGLLIAWTEGQPGSTRIRTATLALE